MAASIGSRCCVNCFQVLRARSIVGGRQFPVSGIQSRDVTFTVDRKDVSQIDPLGSGNIVIPKRKKRDAVSILKALAGTVNKDFNAPSYKYMDDPYLIPTSAVEKRSYALAKAAGQKAASYVVDRFPSSFEHNLAVPSIEAYMPQTGFQHSDEELAGLRERIHARKPLAAYDSYQKVVIAGETVPAAVCQQLLELLCVYNSSDPTNGLLPEEQYFRRDMGQDNRKKIVNTWNDTGPAEQLFLDIEAKSAESYSCMVKGRAKYFQAEKAYQLFNEMKEQGFKADVSVYNAVLRVASFIKDRSDLKWDLTQELLRDMKATGVLPDLQTFNAVFFVLSRCYKTRETAAWAMQTLNEMRRVGIVPSLTTWTYLIHMFYSNEDSQSTIMSDILTEIEGQEFSLQEPTDLDFFYTAMAKCYGNLKDMDLAYKVDALLNHGNNIALLGDGYRDGIYYTYFLRLLCMFEQIDGIMEQYHRMTPHAYTPTFTAMDDLLRAIELNDGYRYLPLVWADLLIFDYSRRTDLIEAMLTTMAKRKQEEQLQEQFVAITDGLKEKYEEDLQNRRLFKPLQLSGSMFGSLIQINLHGGQFDKAWAFFELYYGKKNEVDGFPSEAVMVALCEECIAKKYVRKVMQCLTVMSDCAYPKLDVLAEQSTSTLELSAEQINHIQDLL